MFESFLKPPVTFSTHTDSIVTFNSQYAGLPLKAHTVDVDYNASGVSSCEVNNVRVLSTTLVTGKSISANGEIVYTPTYSCRYFLNDIDDNLRLYISRTSGGGWILRIASYDENDNFIRMLADNTYSVGSWILNVPILASDKKIVFCYVNTINTITSERNLYKDISFNDTIYGGTLDVIKGILTSTKASDGTDLPNPVISYVEGVNLGVRLGNNTISADTGDTTLQYIKLG